MESKDQKNKVIYYGGFAGYRIPINPIEPILEKDAISRKTYCIGYYNAEGKLIRFEKYLDGSLFFQHEYKYHSNGAIKECKSTNRDGEVYIHFYDKKGREIKGSTIKVK